MTAWALIALALWLADLGIADANRTSIIPGFAAAACWIFLALVRSIALPIGPRRFRFIASLRTLSVAMIILAGFVGVWGATDAFFSLYTMFLPIIVAGVAIWWRAGRRVASAPA